MRKMIMAVLSAALACAAFTAVPLQASAAGAYPKCEYYVVSPSMKDEMSADKVTATSSKLSVTGAIRSKLVGDDSDLKLMPPHGKRVFKFKKNCKFYQVDDYYVRMSKKKSVKQLKTQNFVKITFFAAGGKIYRLEFGC